MEKLEALTKKPNAIRMLLLIDGEVMQSEIYHSRFIATGSFYAVLKLLLSLGLIERFQKDGVYYLRLTEKGKKVKECFAKIVEILGE